jgi:hypothetical protein
MLIIKQLLFLIKVGIKKNGLLALLDNKPVKPFLRSLPANDYLNFFNILSARFL